MTAIYKVLGTGFNTKKLTASIWFRLPTTNHVVTGLGGDTAGFTGFRVPILAFGKSDPTNALAKFSCFSAIEITGMSIAVAMCGEDYQQISNGRQHMLCNYDNPTTLTGGAAFPNAMFALHTATLPSSVFDEWHHVLVAVDLDALDTVTNSGATVTGVTRNKKLEIYYDTSRMTGSYRFHMEDTDPTAGINYQQFAMTIQANSLEFALPMLKDYVEDKYRIISPLTTDLPAPEIEYACVQVWMDQYIDPTSQNLEKFVVEIDGKLYSPGGKAAADAFGIPAFWFERDSVSGVRFEENQGTAGDFEVVGIAPVDFSPDPIDEPPDAP